MSQSLRENKLPCVAADMTTPFLGRVLLLQGQVSRLIEGLAACQAQSMLQEMRVSAWKLLQLGETTEEFPLLCWTRSDTSVSQQCSSENSEATRYSPSRPSLVRGERHQ